MVAMTRLAAVRTQLGLLALVRPAAADALVLRLWCTPPRPPARPEIDGPGAGKVVRLDLVGGGRAVAEAWGDGPPVYLVHGWGGRRRQMDAFVAPLVAAGHRVVAVDAPGHGDGGASFVGAGRSTVIDFFEAVEAAVARFGEPVAVVAHSMGTTVAAHMVVHRGLRPERLVLVAPAPPLATTLDDVARLLRLRDGTLERLRARVVDILGLPLATLDLERLAVDGGLGEPGGDASADGAPADRADSADRADGADGAGDAASLPPLPPTLVVHDRGDREAPFATAERLVATWPDVRLVATEGLGHNRILRAPATVEAAVGHLTGRAVAG